MTRSVGGGPTVFPSVGPPSNPQGNGLMAEVRLTRAEAEGDLPAVCMCCGAPATAWVTRSLLLRQPLIGGPRFQPAAVLLIRSVIALAGVPRLRLRPSFSERHRD